MCIESCGCVMVCHQQDKIKHAYIRLITGEPALPIMEAQPVSCSGLAHEKVCEDSGGWLFLNRCCAQNTQVADRA